MLWVLCACLVGVSALPNGVGLTPAMGYNTWNDFRCDGISAANVKSVADKIVALGLNKLGYEYINIDDCWAVGRDANGRVLEDSTGFPDGMKAVADYVHSLGLKFGIYTDRGNLTCAGRPGSAQYEVIDAQTYADWGVDYLKEDSCYASGDIVTAYKDYARMRDALNKTGRQIYFSLCGWNDWYAPFGNSLGNSWRIGGDVNEWESVWNAISINSRLPEFSGVGGWNDPDMLVGSNPAAAVHNTPDQSRTQFNLWAIMAAPLLIGSNVLNMSDYDYQTYSNAEVIAIDQDALGIQGTVVWETCPKPSYQTLIAEAVAQNYSDVPACMQVWSKPLSDGSHAVAFVNYAPTDIVFVCDQICVQNTTQSTGSVTVAVRDVWTHSDLGTATSFTVSIGANGASQVVVLKTVSGESGATDSIVVGAPQRPVREALIPTL